MRQKYPISTLYLCIRVQLSIFSKL